jgi:hypothetical protein
MQLSWNLDPKQINVQRARSAAYQYTLINYIDGRAELKVQHRGDRPSEKPIKQFVYKNRNGAFGGAQRFEDQHGYRDPAQQLPIGIGLLLPWLTEPITDVLHAAQSDARAARLLADTGHSSQDDANEVYAQYQELCASVLCCDEYDCYDRTEIGARRCAEHTEPTED